MHLTAIEKDLKKAATGSLVITESEKVEAVLNKTNARKRKNDNDLTKVKTQGDSKTQRKSIGECKSLKMNKAQKKFISRLWF